MNLSQLVQITPALQALAGTKLPAKSAYRVAKAINLITPELKLFEEHRLKLAEEHGTKSEDGQNYTFANGSAEAFSAALQTLLDEEVAITLPTISPDDLGTADIEPAHLAALDGIIIKDAA